MFLDYRRTLSNYTIDVSQKISCYKKLTINNFWFQHVNGMVGWTTGNLYPMDSNGSFVYNSGYATTMVTNIGKYDADTGILTVTVSGGSNASGGEISVIAVYIDE